LLQRRDLEALGEPRRRRAGGDAPLEADVRLGRPHLLALLPYRGGPAGVLDGNARLRPAQLPAGRRRLRPRQVPVPGRYGRVYQHLPPGGAVLVAEKLLDDDKRGPRWAQLQNLNMLTCTEGTERTLTEYEALLKRVGFAEVVGCRTSSPLDAVLATKPHVHP